MARTSATISVGADTRQLERDIQSALSRDFKFKGLNEKAFTQPLGRITGAANEFQKSLDASNARVIAFGASAGLIFGVERAFSALVKSTIDVQKSLTDINVILNVSTNTLQKFGGELFSIAKDTAQTFDTVAQAATEFSRQGLGLEETLKRTRDALILTRLSGLDTVASVEALTATINSFSNAALDSTTIINKLANVDAAFAVSSADLAEAIKRVGSSAQDVGVDFDELLAIVTSVQQTTARGGAVIGNSLKTIFTRIQRTSTLDALEQLGITVRNLEGDTLPAIQILSNLSETYNTLGDAQRSQVAEQVGGVFQINILKAALADLGKEYSVYNNALKISSSSADEAIQRNEALNQTLSALINRTFVNLTKLGSDIGRTSFQPTFENILNLLNKGLEGIDVESQSTGGKIGKGILEGLGAFIGGPGVVLATAVIGKLLLNLGKFAADSLQTILNINTKAQERAQIQTKINQVLAQEPALVQAVYNKQITVLDVENKILSIIRQQTAERQRAAALSATLAGGLAGRGVTTKGGSLSTKSQGFIPNFALSEIFGALDGGYSPGYIRRMNIPGEGSITYNSAEKVKKFPGFTQPAIMPPIESKAGKKYKDTFSSVYGFNPYASSGFIPNFAKIPASMPIEMAIKGNYSRAALSSRYGKSAVEKVLGPARVASTRQERSLGFTSKISMIYPAKTGASIATGAFSDPQGNRYRVAFNKSGFNEKTAIKPEDAVLEESLAKNIVQFVNGYISQLSNGQFPKINNINQLANAGSFKSIVGTVFETAVAFATKSFKPREGGQSALIDFPAPNKNLRELFNFMPGGYEAKGSTNQDLLNDVARKAFLAGFLNDKISRYKNKSGGFIPNFSALNDAINRELMAGVSPDRVRIGKDRRLTSASNPLGLGVYNTKDEPLGLGQGIARYGSKAKKAGAAGGFVPNFVAPLLAAGAVLTSTRALLALSIGIPILTESIKNLNGQNLTLSKSLDVASQAISFGFAGGLFGKKAGIVSALAGAALALYNIFKDNNDQIKKLTGEIEKNKDILQTFSSAAGEYSVNIEKLQSSQLSDADRGKIIAESNENLATILLSTPNNLRDGLKQAIESGDTAKISERIAEVQLTLQTLSLNTENLAKITALASDKQLLPEEIKQFTKAILETRTQKGTSIAGELVARPKLKEDVRSLLTDQDFLKEFEDIVDESGKSILDTRKKLIDAANVVKEADILTEGFKNAKDFLFALPGGQAKNIKDNADGMISGLLRLKAALILTGVSTEDANKRIDELSKLPADQLEEGIKALVSEIDQFTVNTSKGNTVTEKRIRTEAEYIRAFEIYTLTLKEARDFFENEYKTAKNPLKILAKQQLDFNQKIGDDILTPMARTNVLNQATEEQQNLRSKLQEEILRRERLNIQLSNNEITQEQYQKEIEKTIITEDQYRKRLEALSEKVLVEQRKRGNIFAEDFRVGRQTARENRILGGAAELRDFSDSFFDEFDYGAQEFYRDAQLGAAETARTIKSEFGSAFLDFANGTATAGQAFNRFALNVLDKIQQIALEASINLAFGKLFGSTSNIFGFGGGGGGFGKLFGFNKGGLVKGYSSGGTVTGGSGTKDDVPAMLTNGEYVIKKSAVNKYGSSFLNMLNNQAVEKFQTGGELQTIFQNAYLYNDQFRPTGGGEAIDPRLSLQAITDEENPMNRIRAEREVDLLNYIKYIDDINLQNAENYERYLEGQEQRLRDEAERLKMEQQRRQEIQNSYNQAQKQRQQGSWWKYLFGLGGFGLSFFKDGGYIKKYAQGGLSEDNVPAMLMDGEFVMRKSAVNLYGKDFFNKLNNGRIKKFAEGGPTGYGPTTDISTSGDNYSTNNVNVTVNVTNEGGTSESSDEEGEGGDRDSTEKERRRTKLLAEKVKVQVLKVITEQQRPGGLLYRGR